MIHLDTHVLLFLADQLLKEFSQKTLNLLNEEDLAISPMVELELQYLFEVKRSRLRSGEIIRGLQSALDLQMLTEGFHKVTSYAIDESWTRDPFDRIIVAQARMNDARLLTKDSIIRKHYKKAFWN